jgi:hypothetical protein
VAPNPFWYAKSIAALTSRDRLSICVLVMFAHKSVNQLNMTRIGKPVKPPACFLPGLLCHNWQSKESNLPKPTGLRQQIKSVGYCKNPGAPLGLRDLCLKLLPSLPPLQALLRAGCKGAGEGFRNELPRRQLSAWAFSGAEPCIEGYVRSPSLLTALRVPKPLLFKSRSNHEQKRPSGTTHAEGQRPSPHRSSALSVRKRPQPRTDDDREQRLRQSRHYPATRVSVSVRHRD